LPRAVKWQTGPVQGHDRRTAGQSPFQPVFVWKISYLIFKREQAAAFKSMLRYNSVRVVSIIKSVHGFHGNGLYRTLLAQRSLQSLTRHLSWPKGHPLTIFPQVQ